MALTRGMLKEMGLEQEQIDRIMGAHGSTMADMVTKSEAEEAVKKAVEKAQSEWKASLPKEKTLDDFDDYKKLKAELDGIKQTEALRGAKVLPKYLDLVRAKTDFSDFENSIKRTREEFAEFFESEQPEPSEKAQPEAPQSKPFSAFSAQAKAGDPPKSDEEKAAAEIRKAFGL